MKSNSTALWGGTAGLFLGIAATGHQDLFGAVLGYWLGFVNSAWLYHDAKCSVELDLRRAIAKMRRSFLARLGVVTAVVVGVARFQKMWLPDLALGIAAGLLVSLVSYMRRQVMSGKR